MVCVAISEKNVEKCLKVLEHVEMAEIRLDLAGYNLDEIKTVFSHPTPTIATCRPDKMGKNEQLKRLTTAIEAGAKYVDIEIEADEDIRNLLIRMARKHSCKIIISYHNYDITPGLNVLYKIVDKCFLMGADIAKLSTFSKSKEDNARLLSLYGNEKPIVALGMGEAGKITRIMAPLLGAEFTFAAMDDGQATAPGQITYSNMKDILNQLNQFL
jgi:3-dehydroquinate dehydratase I